METRKHKRIALAMRFFIVVLQGRGLCSMDHQCRVRECAIVARRCRIRAQYWV